MMQSDISSRPCWTEAVCHGGMLKHSGTNRKVSAHIAHVSRSSLTLGIVITIIIITIIAVIIIIIISIIIITTIAVVQRSSVIVICMLSASGICQQFVDLL